MLSLGLSSWNAYLGASFGFFGFFGFLGSTKPIKEAWPL
jgi:hypothetical protein